MHTLVDAHVPASLTPTSAPPPPPPPALAPTALPAPQYQLDSRILVPQLVVEVLAHLLQHGRADLRKPDLGGLRLREPACGTAPGHLAVPHASNGARTLLGTLFARESGGTGRPCSQPSRHLSAGRLAAAARCCCMRTPLLHSLCSTSLPLTTHTLYLARPPAAPTLRAQHVLDGVGHARRIVVHYELKPLLGYQLHGLALIALHPAAAGRLFLFGVSQAARTRGGWPMQSCFALSSLAICSQAPNSTFLPLFLAIRKRRPPVRRPAPPRSPPPTRPPAPTPARPGPPPAPTCWPR